MAHIKKISPLFFLVITQLFGDLQLQKNDVKDTFEEMLSLHVQHEKLEPHLLARSMKTFIEQFDASKMYLLEAEVKAFLNISERKLDKGVNRYKANDLADFEKINTLVKNAIIRAEKWREEIQKELVLSAIDVKPTRGESYLSYAADEINLKKRLHKMLVRILVEEKRVNRMEAWSPKDREKIFTLYEGRFKRKESEYSSDSEHHLALHSLRALAKSLDAHTAYFSPEEARDMRTALEKQFEGVGVVLREGINGILIEDLVKGGPAERCGKIAPGDRIVEIDGESITSKSYEDVLKSMQGKGNKELRLGLQRGSDSKIHEVYLIREKIMMNEDRLRYTSEPVADGHIGILTLPSFYEGGHGSSAESDMREAIKKLKKQAPLKGVILDMRENAGGFLTQAVKISGLFITKGVVVISKYSRGKIKYLRNLDGRHFYDGPLIILTSRASASAAEIVAQALQDYGAALIVGDETTYGKGTIQYQTITDKEAKNFYKVTVGRYYTVSGRSTQIEGVKADIVVPTQFASYKIGERFLENPLPSDQVASAYIDPLTDIDFRNRTWFQKNYLPNLHRPGDRLQKALPILQKNSAERLATDQNFAQFIEMQNKIQGRSARAFRRISNPPWGDQDLQMQETLNIMRDLLSLEKNP
ncbi:MAG: S41 family peptidase [Simkaniaceae bacterium]|nr:S41 family peptidase [Candidatus Sacchlamyda saccharinae]